MDEDEKVMIDEDEKEEKDEKALDMTGILSDTTDSLPKNLVSIFYFCIIDFNLDFLVVFQRVV